MIRNEDELQLAQDALRNLEQVLLHARKHHTTEEYQLLSEPILLEVQDRQREILLFLSSVSSVGAVAWTAK